VTADVWNESADVDAIVRFAAGFLPASTLREFACATARRCAHLCEFPVVSRLLEFADGRTAGPYSEARLRALATESGQLYASLYPGHSAPSIPTLALVAVEAAALTQDPVVAALHASGSAAEAIAQATGASGSDAEYDERYLAARSAEFKAQAELLRKLARPYLPAALR